MGKKSNKLKRISSGPKGQKISEITAKLKEKQQKINTDTKVAISTGKLGHYRKLISKYLS